MHDDPGAAPEARVISSEHLSYFKELFEGRAVLSWHAWFKQNDARLARELPRADYLRLKFHKLDEAEKLLRQAGIEFVISPLARREKYYSLLHESALDERGRPNESFRRKAYNGAVGQFLDGQPEMAKETLADFLQKAKRRQIEELQDLCYDGEIDYEYGDSGLGQMILELVAEIETGDDLLDPVIFRAREVLARARPDR